MPACCRLSPDVLGFRGALCTGNDRTQRIDGPQVKLVRDLIPREAERGDFDAGREGRLAASLGARLFASTRSRKGKPTAIFVHDLVLAISIGAYDFERDRTQRVRFNVDVDVRRAGHHAEDMRDIFSYDLIVDAIRLILSRGHIDLVETLAERIADALLAHPRVDCAKIRIEKLDVIEGSVGIEIKRERQAQSAKSRQLFAELSDFAASPGD